MRAHAAAANASPEKSAWVARGLHARTAACRELIAAEPRAHTPGTVMVHTHDAAVADAAVVRARRLFAIAALAALGDAILVFAILLVLISARLDIAGSPPGRQILAPRGRLRCGSAATREFIIGGLRRRRLRPMPAAAANLDRHARLTRREERRSEVIEENVDEEPNTRRRHEAPDQ